MKKSFIQFVKEETESEYTELRNSVEELGALAISMGEDLTAQAEESGEEVPQVAKDLIKVGNISDSLEKVKATDKYAEKLVKHAQKIVNTIESASDEMSNNRALVKYTSTLDDVISAINNSGFEFSIDDFNELLPGEDEEIT